MNDNEIFNSTIDLIDGLSSLAFERNDSTILDFALQLESIIDSSELVDSQLLLDLSIGVDSVSNYLFDIAPDVALTLSDTATVYEEYAYKLDEIESQLDEIEGGEPAHDIDDLLEQIYTEQRELLAELDDSTPDIGNNFDEGSDSQIALDYGLVIYTSIPDGMEIRPRSASTQVEDVIDYIGEIGVDGISDIYYDEDSDLYYAVVSEDSEVNE